MQVCLYTTYRFTTHAIQEIGKKKSTIRNLETESNTPPILIIRNKFTLDNYMFV